jgi:hypothetical protein
MDPTPDHFAVCSLVVALGGAWDTSEISVTMDIMAPRMMAFLFVSI